MEYIDVGISAYTDWILSVQNLALNNKRHTKEETGITWSRQLPVYRLLYVQTVGICNTTHHCWGFHTQQHVQH